MAFQADGNSVWIVMAKERYLASATLNEVEEKTGWHEFLSSASQRAGEFESRSQNVDPE
jgi:hypothetical protein